MKRVLTATGLAAMFAVGLAAQATTGTTGTTAQDPQTTTAGGGQRGPRTITGCLRAGDTAGTYMLTNVEGMGGRNAGAATTTGAGTTTGSTTTGGTTTGGATTTGAGATTGGQGRPASIMLSADSSVDLAPHVGHKIEVTGTLAGGGRRGGNGDTTATATGTGTTTGGTGTATGTATGTTTGSGQTAATSGGQGRGGPRSMTVTAVKMVSESCS